MNTALALTALLVPVMVISGLAAQTPSGSDDLGQTAVMKWKDGKQAAFLLAFDDSCPSHLTNAIPELEKHHLVGTFYINAGNGPYQAHTAEWAKAAKSPAVVLGNHTFKHAGATSAEQLEGELAKANEVIYALNSDRKPPYLISFARPGGVPWTVEQQVNDEKLAKYHLAPRPPFQGPPLTHKTLEEGFKILDAALAKGEMGHLDFHGVGGDWHVAPMDYFVPMLDRLQAEAERLWVTDHITYHKYLLERQSAKVAVVVANDREIRLKLSSGTDPAFYDQPLTLRTRVPGDWKTCTLTQGQNRGAAKITDGIAQYDAAPGVNEIVLRPGE